MNANNPIIINVKFYIAHESLEAIQDELKEDYNYEIAKKQALKIYKKGLQHSGEKFEVEPIIMGDFGLFYDIKAVKNFLNKK